MDVAIVVAIFVSILGLSIILAAVWLYYQWRRTRRDVNLPTHNSDLTPLKRLAVDHGKIISVPGQPRPPSAISGWSSVRHCSWLMSGSSIARNDEASFRDSRYFQTQSLHFGPQLEQGIKEVGLDWKIDNCQTVKTPAPEHELLVPPLGKPSVVSPPLTRDTRYSSMSDASCLKPLPNLPTLRSESLEWVDLYWNPSIYQDVPRKFKPPGPPTSTPLGHTFLDAPSVEKLEANPQRSHTSPFRSTHSMERLPQPLACYSFRRNNHDRVSTLYSPTGQAHCEGEHCQTSPRKGPRPWLSTNESINTMLFDSPPPTSTSNGK